jgi:hypothetical protein
VPRAQSIKSHLAEIAAKTAAAVIRVTTERFSLLVTDAAI